jgi:hypothetical protein
LSFLEVLGVKGLTKRSQRVDNLTEIKVFTKSSKALGDILFGLNLKVTLKEI